jgi:hypothetical protein
MLQKSNIFSVPHVQSHIWGSFCNWRIWIDFTFAKSIQVNPCWHRIKVICWIITTIPTL